MAQLTIKVKVIKAILTHNTEIGSEMVSFIQIKDPFVVLKMGTNQQRGKTFDEAGDMPVFNQQFEFPYQGHLTMFHLIVYDEDATIDDLVGEVQIDLKPIISQDFTQRSNFVFKKQEWYSLKYDGKKPAGKIMLEFECNRNSLTMSQNQKIIKQLIKPNIHHIGEPAQVHKKHEIHHLQPSQRHCNYQQQQRNPITTNKTSQFNSPKFNGQKVVFSFKDNAVHNKQSINNSYHQFHLFYTQPSTQTINTQKTIYDSHSVRDLSENNISPYQNNLRYYENRQMNEITTPTYVTSNNSQMYHRTRQYQSSINYTLPSSNIYFQNNFATHR